MCHPQPLSSLLISVAVTLQSSLPHTDRLLVFSLPDRVVDDLNPMLNFTRKEVENLLHFVEKEPAPQASLDIKGIKEPVLQLACRKYPHLITKVRARVQQPLAGQRPAGEARLVSLSLCKLLFHAGSLNAMGSFPCPMQFPPLVWSYKCWAQPCGIIWPVCFPSRKRDGTF